MTTDEPLVTPEDAEGWAFGAAIAIPFLAAAVLYAALF